MWIAELKWFAFFASRLRFKLGFGFKVSQGTNLRGSSGVFWRLHHCVLGFFREEKRREKRGKQEGKEKGILEDISVKRLRD